MIRTKSVFGLCATRVMSWLGVLAPLLPCVLLAVTALAEDSASRVAGAYPRKELLIEAREIPSGKPSSRVILDTRDRAKYLEGHIPQAVWVDAASWAQAVKEDQDAANWTRRFAEVGINDMSEVIIYDDQRLRSAARTWWILRLWGVAKTRILNGAWDGYVEASLPVETGAGQTPAPGNVVATRQQKALATKELLLSKHRSGQLGGETGDFLQVIDTRSKGEYCGTEPSRAKRTGSIPGSKHLEWSDLLVPDSSRLKSVDELRSLFAEAGINVEKPAATFCQGGGRASVMVFGLELMGSPEARNYYPGWGEWGNDDATPVDRPE